MSLYGDTVQTEYGRREVKKMLVPAILYKDEIHKEFAKYNYTDDMIYYTGYLGNSLANIADSDDGNSYQYAIVDDNRVIGYFTYCVDWYVSCARCFGLFSFDRNNRIIGLDVHRELKKLINDYHIHRIEWRMVEGNPAEKHYNRFCKKHNGKKLVLTDAIKDRFGKYHDDVIYEIIFEER